MKKLVAVLLTILMLFSLFQGALVRNMVKGAGYQWIPINNGLYKRFVYSLAIDPTNTATVYAGTWSGGICKSSQTFTITASAGIGGVIYPSGIITINQEGSQTFTIIPDIGYSIKIVLVDGVSVGAVSIYTFANITVDHTLEAIFAVNNKSTTYTIEASTTIGGSIDPSGTVPVNNGGSKTFRITPNQGYHLKDVKVDGVSVGAVLTYSFTNVTSNHTIDEVFEKYATVIRLQIGNNFMDVNGGDSSQTLDSPPVIKNDRTLVPIRAIIEALGGTVGWDANEKKVTVTLGSTTIELWIKKKNAKVNGVDTPIDATNSKVVPEIINSRTMLPLRFVTENLGCDVQWDDATKTITITYQP